MNTKRGFGLMEVVVAAAVFAFVSLAVYQSYAGLLNLVRLSRVKITASNLANEQFEIARNLPYSDVGLVNGVPSGKIPHIQNLSRDGINFTVTSFVRAIDDPFDGLIGSGDTSFAPDAKLLEVTIECSTCKNFTDMVFVARIAPKDLESFSNNGALLIKVFDANGVPIPNASVSVVNNLINPVVSVSDETNNDGELLLTDVIPSNESYEITVSKTGYSTDKTYPTSDPMNLNPTNPHATVITSQLTQKSFSIDTVGSLEISSATNNCAAVPNIDFTMRGDKTIGTNGTGSKIYKYDKIHQTNGSGIASLSNIEWDKYYPTLTDTVYDLVGTMSPIPITVDPGATKSAQFIVQLKDPQSLLVTVKDSATAEGLPLKDANVRIVGGGFDITKTTGRGFLSQTDWSSGGGQTDFVDNQRFASSDGNIDYAGSPGEIKLNQFGGIYQTSGFLESSTFDTGSASNFYEISWLPIDQPAPTGADSVRVQIATSNSATEDTWVYKGPDGTSGTYYTVANNSINSVHNGDRYLRYKVYLTTEDNVYTPNVSDINFTFTSSCIPPGQVFFSGITNGSYDVIISKAGYQTHSETYSVSSAWQDLEVSLIPE